MWGSTVPRDVVGSCVEASVGNVQCPYRGNYSTERATVNTRSEPGLYGCKNCGRQFTFFL